MIRALYTAGLGMTSQMKRMDVISNNIANVDTTGYKKDGAVTRSFTEEYLKRINDAPERKLTLDGRIGKTAQGLFVDTVYTDFSVGGLRVTGGPLDLALAGEGFFSVRGRNGNDYYTRDGSFTLMVDRRLVTKDGYGVLDNAGNPITLPDGEITVGERGAIVVNGENVATLRIVDFENPDTLKDKPKGLKKFGDNLYEATEDSVQRATTGSIVQGALENSNVNAVREMVEIINISRIYEMNQRMVQNADQTMGRIATDIGKKA